MSFDGVLNLHTNDTNTDALNINVCSWNIWCIPFASPRTLSNYLKCAKYLLNHQPTHNKVCDHPDASWFDPDAINILCIQELWSWRIGLFPAFALRFIAYSEYIPLIGWIISLLFQLLSMICGLLFAPCFNRRYDPKQYFARQIEPLLPYHVYHSDLPFPRMLDNGLMILSNAQPTEHGSEMYDNAVAEDYYACKGFLWAYFANHRLLVINTHLQCAGGEEVRTMQLKQMKIFINSWKNEVDKIIVCGDFNMDMQQFRSPTKCGTGTKLFCFNRKNISDGSPDVGDKEMDVNNEGDETEIVVELSPIVHGNAISDSYSECIRQRSIASSIISNISRLRHSIDCDVNISTMLEMKKVSSYEPTFIETKENIDHVFASWIPNAHKTMVFTDQTMRLSDHKLVVVRLNN
eukprot:230295_1